MAEPVDVTVRYFAAAQAAAGMDCEQLTVGGGATIGHLVDSLAEHGPQLAHVLRRCSFLCDGIAVRDTRRRVQPGMVIDVLPPFAGG